MLALRIVYIIAVIAIGVLLVANVGIPLANPRIPFFWMFRKTPPAKHIPTKKLPHTHPRNDQKTDE